jgi:HAD superfamily hydrolase (TIGR01662 family)
VLIDLDDTLFDHRAAARQALLSAAAADPALGRCDFETLEQRHRAILEALHRRVLDGAMTVDEARALRFRMLVEENDAAEPCDAARIDRITIAYRAAYSGNWTALAGARGLLAEIQTRGVRIAVVTNNIVSEQVAKLKALDLESLVDALVVSEAVGASKPAAAIFEHALNALGVAADDSVMVGDNWSADVEGARAAGIAAVWFNPRRLPRPAAHPGVVEIHALEPAGRVADMILGSPVP